MAKLWQTFAFVHRRLSFHKNVLGEHNNSPFWGKVHVTNEQQILQLCLLEHLTPLSAEKIVIDVRYDIREKQHTATCIHTVHA